MIQDIAPHKLINHYDPSFCAEKEDRILLFHGTDLLIRDSEELDFPQIKDFPELCEKESFPGLTYLFSVDNDHYYMLREASLTLPEGCSFRNVRTLRSEKRQPKHRAYAMLTAKHLMDWYRDNAFCGRCGKPMKHSATERAMTCECGYTCYPRIMPAVIVGVTNGDEIILTSYPNRSTNALIAGFTEIGETLEETVQREVEEEVGVHVKNIRYYKSQPWGIANDILMGFYCELDGDPTIHIDENELGRAEWTRREDIVLQPDDFSLTNEMMMMFKENRV